MKETYTKLFLKELGKTINDQTVSEYMPLWWQNTRVNSHTGLRLTDKGYETICEIGLATYNIPFPLDMTLTTQVILFLDKFIDCPYYLTKKGIIVTNERKAVELTLFSGDVRKYGIAKALNRSNQE